MSWDAENGVWVGDKAIAASAEDLPNPLYLFGYGSLIWRSGDLLAGMKTYHCKCHSWSRVFAQRSMDHRGRPIFPGLVLNLVSDKYLEENNLRSRGDSAVSSCVGVVYHIPEAQTVDIVAELDFRERGGYQRHIVQVELLEDTNAHKKGDLIDVLVYIGSADNPNFIYDPSDQWYTKKVNIISAAFGPSGHNRDYLFPLVQFFHDHNYSDPYLYQLEHDVRMRLGRWRGRAGDDAWRVDLPPGVLLESTSGGSLQTEISAVTLWGWGSVEYGQLSIGSSFVSKETHENIFGAVPIGGVGVSGATVSDLAARPHPRRFVALAGGSHSGCIIDDALYLWGSQAQGQVGPGRISCGVVGASLGHEHTLVLLKSGMVISFGEDSYGQSSGGSSGAPSFVKYISSWPEVLLSTGLLEEPSAAVMSCWELLLADAPRGSAVEEAQPKVVQVCAGVRHSVALCEDGYVYTWGGGRHSRLLLAGPAPWRPAAEGETVVRIVDVAVGCDHTVALDSVGRVWAFGSNNKHLQLGRPASEGLEPRVVALPEDVIWQRVSSGWSHSVARGARSDGSVCVYVWGRADMGSTASAAHALRSADEDSSSKLAAEDAPPVAAARDVLPHELPPLPAGGSIEEVWCGSEYTLACNKQGLLWACGWNEHGNLGIGRSEVETSATWEPVVTGTLIGMPPDNNLPDPAPASPSGFCQLLAGWEGALACGGGHCVAFLQST